MSIKHGKEITLGASVTVVPIILTLLLNAIFDLYSSGVIIAYLLSLALTVVVCAAVTENLNRIIKFKDESLSTVYTDFLTFLPQDSLEIIKYMDTAPENYNEEIKILLKYRDMYHYLKDTDNGTDKGVREVALVKLKEEIESELMKISLIISKGEENKIEKIEHESDNLITDLKNEFLK